MTSRQERSVKFDEQLAFQLRALYSRYGYTHYRMSKFEEYELYVQNKDFLASSEIITFTDTNGRLMALKPDVTLSIIKNLRTSVGIQKVFYHENVYRVSKNSGSYREIMQTGLECIGEIGHYEICEALLLAIKSLEATGRDFRLDLAHMGLLSGLISELAIPDEVQSELLTCIKRKNADGASAICKACGSDERKTEELVSVIGLYGSLEEIIPHLKDLLSGEKNTEYVSELEKLTNTLSLCGYSDKINIDFSVVNDMNYYNGIVFRGYIEGIPDGILSGGCYDLLMKKMGRNCGAVGFAVSLDPLDRLKDTRRDFDYDCALIYEEESADKALLTVRELTEEGKIVFAAKELPCGIRAAEIYRVLPDGTQIREDK